MGSKFWPQGGVAGVLHHYTESLVAFEYTSGTIPKPHSLLFIGGLGDGLATTAYMADIVQALDTTKWSIFTLNLSSSYHSWGLGHLGRDIDELAQCIHYVQDYKRSKFGDGKFVLMGHSTGSQDVLHYLHKPNPLRSTPAFDPGLRHIRRPAIDGAIMQAAVSDREAIQWCLETGIGGKSPAEIRAVYDKMRALAKEAARHHQATDTILPMWMTGQIYPSNTPISCRRFLSLVSPESPQAPSEDDLFSSDLSDAQLAKTFGMVKEQGLLKYKLMVLLSGADQSVPDWVDKEQILERWRNATDHNGKFAIWDQEHTAIVPGASHALSNDDQEEPRKFLVGKVMGYLQALEKSS
ncbi:hypothetical protein E2P81_ATG02997 [Venturia nashicola]|uniref:DUF1749-domain-containing protein n=1 Tax=Venturia nashicola TaxID=86259 RepID=A0A4Z1PDV7_9PEZI|nr:hypothetical protein E6O75_ATG03062 [Venturia nashicola]TLD36108.1 hypothetical protein E2P81_ATG02997 [Venturia nashicola]